MKIKVSDYIADYIVEKGIDTMFTITGGGAMHLNDSFGHKKGLKCYYNHHEQACSTAAEGYYRVNGKMAAVCVTTGPGGTNAITGVMSAYLDSIPMIIISGQVKTTNTVKYTGLNLRQFGDQEFDIVRMIKYVTKYAITIDNPLEIKYHLQKAFECSKNGRPGPVWLDIPLDIQSATIETDDLIEYKENLETNIIKDNQLEIIKEKIKTAERPIIYVGSSVRLSGNIEIFNKLIEKLNIPVVVACNSIDSIPTSHRLYAGIGGSNGNRAGNFAVQNSDLIISLGCRLSLRQVGFNYETWAREAFVVMNDIDEEEMNKPSVHVDLKIKSDVGFFMKKLLELDIKFQKKDWIDKCQYWIKKYPVVTDKMQQGKEINVYNFIKVLTENFQENSVMVVGNGSACVAGSQASIVKKEFKYIMNSGSAQMGYDLPAAIGACVGNNLNEIICVTGDGSIQMNIQELQTIVTNNLKIKIFIINNDGYHSIRQTQNNFFSGNIVGIGPESNDLSFPNMKKIANAYGIKYYSINNNNNKMYEKIKEVLNQQAPLICEVFVSKKQNFEPKPSSRKLEDGTMVSSPLEDLYPFLDREELKENMFIKLVDE